MTEDEHIVEIIKKTFSGHQKRLSRGKRKQKKMHTVILSYNQELSFQGIASNTMVEKLTSVSKNWDLHLLSNLIKGGSINISTSAAKSFEKGHASYRTSFEGHTYYVRKTHVPRSKDDDLHGFLRKIIRSFSLTTMGLQRICQHTEILLKFRS